MPSLRGCGVVLRHARTKDERLRRVGAMVSSKVAPANEAEESPSKQGGRARARGAGSARGGEARDAAAQSGEESHAGAPGGLNGGESGDGPTDVALSAWKRNLREDDD